MKFRELTDYLTSFDGVRVSWNQEFYVAFILAERNWITMDTFPNQLNIRIHVETGSFKKEEIVKMLAINMDKIDIEQGISSTEVKINLYYSLCTSLFR
jgi:ADP-dependent phosphofructokinase/glucokinase